MKDLNLDKFVDDAIKVEEGEIETLRPPPVEPFDVMMAPFTFADDDEGRSLFNLIDANAFRLQSLGIL